MNDEIRNRILDLWRDGVAPADIGLAVGKSRNSVLGCVYRARERGDDRAVVRGLLAHEKEQAGEALRQRLAERHERAEQERRERAARRAKEVADDAARVARHAEARAQAHAEAEKAATERRQREIDARAERLRLRAEAVEGRRQIAAPPVVAVAGTEPAGAGRRPLGAEGIRAPLPTISETRSPTTVTAPVECGALGGGGPDADGAARRALVVPPPPPSITETHGLPVPIPGNRVTGSVVSGGGGHTQAPPPPAFQPRTRAPFLAMPPSVAHRTCQWIEKGSRLERPQQILMCGAPTFAGRKSRSWCEHHYRVVFVPRERRAQQEAA